MGRSDAERVLAALWERERQKCAEDVLYFAFSGYVCTKDEHDKRHPVKVFEDLPYLRYTLNRWFTGEKVQFVAKSRQLRCSWLLCIAMVWVAKFHPHRLCLFQSKKAEDAYKMVALKYPDQARCTFIEKHLPPWLKVCRGDKGEWIPFKIEDAMVEGRVIYPNGSTIEAIPQGPAQIEGRVPSFFGNDEASLQEEWRAGHAAAMPCVTGATEEETAHYITLATMRPSAYGDEIAGAGLCDPDGIMRGVGEFKSLSGVPTLRIHYTADPAKDPRTEAGLKWLARAMQGYSGADDVNWRQHMEIDPEVQSGRPVVPAWNDIKPRVVIEPIPIEAMHGWRLSSGLDWGASNKSVWLIWANDFAGNRYCVHQLAIPGNQCGGIKGFAAKMKSSPHFERCNGTIQADPSIWNKDQNTQGGLVSKAQLFAEEGVFLQPAKTKGQQADEILINRLQGAYWPGAGTDEFEPTLYIFNTCTELIRTIPIWRYEEWSPALAGDRSLKEKMRDFEVDSFDAWKYDEVNHPEPAHASRTPPAGSIQWMIQQIRRGNREATLARS